MSQELRTKLKRERKARREADVLLGERSIELTKALAEIERLRQEGTQDLTGEHYAQIIASLHEPMKPLLESIADLFTLLPHEADALMIKDGVRQELANLIAVLQSLQSREAVVHPNAR